MSYVLTYLQAIDSLTQYFQENPNAQAYFANLNVDGNAKVSLFRPQVKHAAEWVMKVLQSVVLQAKKLGKSVYLFSVDTEQGKVAHVNFVADDAKARGLDARTWANPVVEILGGKVGLTVE